MIQLLQANADDYTWAAYTWAAAAIGSNNASGHQPWPDPGGRRATAGPRCGQAQRTPYPCPGARSWNSRWTSPGPVRLDLVAVARRLVEVAV